MAFTTEQKAYFALAATSIIWGTTWVANKIAVAQVPGLQISYLRQFFAGILFIIYFKLKGEPWPSFRQLKPLLFISFFLIILNSGLSTWSLGYIPAGLGALIGAMAPVCMVLLEMILYKSRNTLFTYVGLLVGFAGISMVFYENAFSNHNKGYIFGLFLGVAAMIAWSAGCVLVSRKKIRINPYYGLGWQMLMGAPFIYLFSLATGNHIPVNSIPFTSWAAIIYLIFIGSIIAFACFMYSTKHLPMSISSLYAYFNPIIAIIVGALLLKEKLTINILTGSAITLVGVYLVNYSMREKIHKQIVFKRHRKKEASLTI